MGYHRNTLLSSNEDRSKAYNPYNTKKISLFTPENIGLVTPGENFVCNVQIIMTSRYQGRKLGLDISRISTDHYSHIIGRYSNALLPDKGGNKVS